MRNYLPENFLHLKSARKNKFRICMLFTDDRNHVHTTVTDPFSELENSSLELPDAKSHKTNDKITVAVSELNSIAI